MNQNNSGSKDTKKQEELFITRIFDAPRELVWKAWTEPELMKRWWGPKGFTSPVCNVYTVIVRHVVLDSFISFIYDEGFSCCVYFSVPHAVQLSLSRSSKSLNYQNCDDYIPNVEDVYFMNKIQLNLINHQQ
jgi:hypothetical protein